MKILKVMLGMTAAVAASLLASAASAQTYPERTITMVVPFSAGGPTDTVARLVAESMSKDLGQQVIVENVGGAGGTLGAGRVADADPDGYTILLHHIGMATSATLYRKLAYDTLNAFEYVGLVTDVPMTIVARKDFEPTDLKGLVDYVKANKKTLRLAPNKVEYTEPVWLAFDPEHGKGKRPDSFWGQSNLAASEVFSALIQFPEWPLAWFNGASAPTLSGYQLKYDTDWSFVPCLRRWDGGRRLLLHVSWASAATAAGRRLRSGSADTGTLVPWYPEGFCNLGLLSLKTLPFRMPALTFVLSSAMLRFFIFAKIDGELVSVRMFTDVRHRFRVLKLTELVCFRAN